MRRVAVRWWPRGGVDSRVKKRARSPGGERARGGAVVLPSVGTASRKNFISMLKVEKERLEAETVQKVAHLRQVELQYYIDHIGGIQTMATLLAGFAFTAFNGFEGGFNLDAFFFTRFQGSYDLVDGNGTLRVDPVKESFDAMMFVKFVMETFEVAAVTLTLGEMLYVMIETLIARLLGSRLALRGPDGSINTANRHLAEALANSTKHFILGLQWFLLSVLCHALRGMHIISSMLVLFILSFYWKSQFVTVGRLAKQFELKTAVITDFDDDLEASCGPESSGGLSESQRPSPAAHPRKVGRLWRKRGANKRGSIFAAVPEVTQEAQYAMVQFFNPLAQARALFDQVDDTHNPATKRTVLKNRPTQAARKLIMREQARQERGAEHQHAELEKGAACASPDGLVGSSRTTQRYTANSTRSPSIASYLHLRRSRNTELDRAPRRSEHERGGGAWSNLLFLFQSHDSGNEPRMPWDRRHSSSALRRQPSGRNPLERWRSILWPREEAADADDVVSAEPSVGLAIAPRGNAKGGAAETAARNMSRARPQVQVSFEETPSAVSHTTDAQLGASPAPSPASSLPRGTMDVV